MCVCVCVCKITIITCTCTVSVKLVNGLFDEGTTPIGRRRRIEISDFGCKENTSVL